MLLRPTLRAPTSGPASASLPASRRSPEATSRKERRAGGSEVFVARCTSANSDSPRSTEGEQSQDPGKEGTNDKGAGGSEVFSARCAAAIAESLRGTEGEQSQDPGNEGTDVKGGGAAASTHSGCGATAASASVGEADQDTGTRRLTGLGEGAAGGGLASLEDSTRSTQSGTRTRARRLSDEQAQSKAASKSSTWRRAASRAIGAGTPTANKFQYVVEDKHTGGGVLPTTGRVSGKLLPNGCVTAFGGSGLQPAPSVRGIAWFGTLTCKESTKPHMQTPETPTQEQPATLDD